MNQKVPKISELFGHKKSSRAIFKTMRELLFVEITGKTGVLPYKHEKCRICMVDKFGTYHGGGGWIRTTVGIASRFTVCPLWPLGNTPICALPIREKMELVDGFEPPTC